jgi:prepilin peptidase CpaA
MLSDYGSSLSTITLLTNAILVVLFSSAAVTDLKWKKIYNVQTYPAIACGLILGFAASGLPGLAAHACGLGVGFCLLLVFYLMGGMGAGDVKLLGAIGALKGSTFVVWTMFYTGLVGGVMALSVIIWHGTVRKTLKNLLFFVRHPVRAQQEQDDEQQHHYLPYGFAISLGCFFALCTL